MTVMIAIFQLISEWLQSTIKKRGIVHFITSKFDLKNLKSNCFNAVECFLLDCVQS